MQHVLTGANNSVRVTYTGNRVNFKFTAIGHGNELTTFSNELQRLLKPYNVQSGGYNVSPSWKRSNRGIDVPVIGRINYRLTFHNAYTGGVDLLIQHLVNCGYVIHRHYTFTVNSRANGKPYKVPQQRDFIALTEFKAKELLGKVVCLHCPCEGSDNGGYTAWIKVGKIEKLVGAFSGKVRGLQLLDESGNGTGVFFDSGGDAWCFDEIYPVYVSI
jgi:hypothetical protein